LFQATAYLRQPFW